MVLAVVNGPNLGRLGAREPEVYGRVRLSDIVDAARDWGAERGIAIDAYQANGEGQLIDFFEAGIGRLAGAVLNPGALGHCGWALRDCIAALDYPVVEVHLTNVFRREPFRSQLVLAPVVMGQIVGLGAHGYRLALTALAERDKPWPPGRRQDLEGGFQP